MPVTKSDDMIVLQANPLKPVRRLSVKEAALRMLRDVSRGQDDLNR